jgi:hypothetical protein
MYAMSPHSSASHEGTPDDISTREYPRAFKTDDDNDDDSAPSGYDGQHAAAAFYDYVPLHRQMTVTPVADHVALADTVLNSPSMASIVIHSDADLDPNKRRCRLSSPDHLTIIKGV